MRAGAQQLRRLLWGIAAAACLAIGAGLLWSREAAQAALLMGLLATGMQLVAARVMRRTGGGSIDQVKIYMLGAVLRLLGVVLLGVLVTVDRHAFPLLPSAAGYLGTVLPLLYLETRLAQ
jgi:hypothetical protein